MSMCVLIIPDLELLSFREEGKSPFSIDVADESEKEGFIATGEKYHVK